MTNLADAIKLTVIHARHLGYCLAKAEANKPSRTLRGRWLYQHLMEGNHYG